MLTVTTAAADSIKSLVVRGGVLGRGGLRVEAAPGHDDGGTFALSLAPAPSEGDQVVAGPRGANVFIEATAAAHLADKVLDVRKDHDGRAKFKLLRVS